MCWYLALKWERCLVKSLHGLYSVFLEERAIFLWIISNFLKIEIRILIIFCKQLVSCLVDFFRFCFEKLINLTANLLLGEFKIEKQKKILLRITENKLHLMIWNLLIYVAFKFVFVLNGFTFKLNTTRIFLILI